MRAVGLLLFATALLFAIGCGGGEGEKTETSEAQTPEATTPAPAPTPSGYTVMAVADGGSITGTVKYAGPAPAQSKLPVTKDTEVCGKTAHYDETLVVNPKGGVKGVVVSIQGITSGKSMDALGTEFVLNQEGCLYSPHVLVVPVNAQMKILNPDGILHNIHTYSEKNPSFNKSQPKFKKEMETAFTQPEHIRVKCDVHGWMSANILAVDHPYYAVTTAEGSYTLSEVPPGTYTVEFWQEKLGKQTAQVTVAAGAPATLDFTFPAEAGASD